MRHETSVLTSRGRLHFTQREHESQAEFDGRVLCEIEDALGGHPTPAGTRWARWDHHGHPLRRFHANGLGSVVESTGNAYTNRTRRIPGLYNEAEARKAIG